MGTSHGVGALAVLYQDEARVATMRYHLGAPHEYTVYEAEAVGLVLAAHLMTFHQVRFPVKISSTTRQRFRLVSNLRRDQGIAYF